MTAIMLGLVYSVCRGEESRLAQPGAEEAATIFVDTRRGGYDDGDDIELEQDRRRRAA
jgi:hypothetical protein